MSTQVVVIAGCALVTFAIKASGPVLLGGRELPAPVQGVLALMAPALLAALVVVSALAEGDRWHVGPDTAGVLAGAGAFLRTGSIVGCVVLSAAVTALLRAV